MSTFWQSNLGSSEKMWTFWASIIGPFNKCGPFEQIFVELLKKWTFWASIIGSFEKCGSFDLIFRDILTYLNLWCWPYWLKVHHFEMCNFEQSISWLPKVISSIYTFQNFEHIYILDLLWSAKLLVDLLPPCPCILFWTTLI